MHILQYTAISLFSSWKYFRTALVDRKFVTRILFHNENFSPSKNFLKLESAAVTKWESRTSLCQYFKLLLYIYLIAEDHYPKRSLPSLLRRCTPVRVPKWFHINWKYFRTVTPVRNLFHTIFLTEIYVNEKKANYGIWTLYMYLYV